MTNAVVSGSAAQGNGQATKAKSLRVKVLDNAKDGRAAVNISMPIAVVRFGLRMARTFSPELKDTNLDWDAINAMIEDGARGEIVHVEDEREHKTVEVWVE